MSTPKRHHYLPAFYLDGFCHEGLLCVYDRERREYRVQQPHDTAVRRYYYAVTDEDGTRNLDIEKAFSRLESDTKPVIAKLDNREAVTAEERDTLAHFIGFLFVRVPEFEDRVNRVYEHVLRAATQVAFATDENGIEQLRQYAERTGEPFDEAEARATAEFARSGAYGFDIHRNQSLHHMLKHGPVMGRVFRQMEWLVLHPAEAKAAFITTDKPVCVLPPPGYMPNFYGFGIATIGAMKVVPLSQKTCLLIRDMGDALQHIDAGQDQVRRINLNVTAQCQQFVIGRHKRLVGSLVSTTHVDSTERQPTIQVSGLGAKRPEEDS